MARAKKNGKRKIENYTHKDKDRLNNPPAGLVTPETDRDTERKTYAYDPHLDPQLVWAGKAEHTSFEVPTVSLHVHERIDPASIIEAVKKRNGSDPQLSLFADPAENPPIREAIEFYKHKHNWSNRLIAGDSLLVMNSLLEKEGMAGQVQMVYIDPPYGIRYGSNFQPFVNKRDVKDGKDEDLNQEPEMIKAFRDTWELGIHSYLTYLRDRLLLARELLHESGSCFVQISDENLHLVRCLMDEVFGVGNFVGIIVFSKTTGFSGATLSSVADYLVWYGRDIKQIKYRQPLQLKHVGNEGATAYKPISEFLISSEYRHDLTRLATSDQLTSQGASNTPQEFVFAGKIFNPPKGLHWKTTIDGMERLSKAGRIFLVGNTLRYLRFLDDFPVFPLSNVWTDTGIAGYTADKRYVVQTLPKVIERCLLMTTDPGDLVFDPTCGSGTTAYVAEKWGRRWITCDTSRVAVTLAKQRLMTTAFGYYELAHPEEGVSSGFRYGTVPHVTLKSIANNPEIREGMTQKQIDAAIAKYAEQETLYDQPFVDKSRTRVTGPFTVEAVPSPAVKALDEIEEGNEQPADGSVSRTGETRRQGDWRDELFKTGIRCKNGQMILFSRVEPLAGTRWLHADAETRPNDLGRDTVKESEVLYGGPQRVAISFGPEHAPLEQRQVALAIEEAQTLVPRPKMIVFAAFQFDPEAAKDIDETQWPGVTLLKAQMNADLLTGDLKKKRSSNESFWLIGQPDVVIEKIRKGDDKGKYQVSVQGFDYYNTKTGAVESGSSDKIALWMLDPDYDGRSVFPRQVFFPMA
ncbi:MAG: site-specific DNA-methyltransferase, partial [Nitrospinae bacterium CG11_big_fil_rev_8_21_14_0_20_56_8]